MNIFNLNSTIFNSYEDVEEFLEQFGYEVSMNQIHPKEAQLLFGEEIIKLKKDSFLHDAMKKAFNSALSMVPALPSDLVLFHIGDEQDDQDSHPFLSCFFVEEDLKALNKKHIQKIYVPQGSRIIPICGVFALNNDGDCKKALIEAKYLQKIGDNEFVFDAKQQEIDLNVDAVQHTRRARRTYQKLTLANQQTHLFLNKTDLLADPLYPDYQILHPLYMEAEKISELLGVEEFDISYIKGLMRDQYSPLEAVLLTQKDFSELKKPLLIFDLDLLSQRKEVVIATLAHEIRHLYQEKHAGEYHAMPGTAYDFYESLYDLLEMDADAFAICYLMKKYHLSIDEATDYVCSDMKRFFFFAYKLRKDFAKQMIDANEKNGSHAGSAPADSQSELEIFHIKKGGEAYVL